MRVSTFMIYNMLTRSLNSNLRELTKYSEMLSTGKKITKPSDDVSGMSKALNYKFNLDEVSQYMSNVDEATSYLSYTDTVMSTVADGLTRAREIAMEAANGTLSDVDREILAEEVDELVNNLLNLSNSKFGNRYIFSGYKTDTQAFDSNFNYQGNSGEIMVMIDRNATIAINIPGNEAFVTGGKTYFEILDDLKDALLSNDITTIQNSITEIDNALTQVSKIRADVGARLNTLENKKIALEDREYNLTVWLSNTQDADIAEVSNEIAKLEIALQTLKLAGAEAVSNTLLNFL